MSSRAPIGYVALPSVPFCTNQGCKTIKPRNGFHSEFLYYNILFNVDKVKNLGEGTTFAEISKTKLETVALVFPKSSSEQAKIAEILSTVDRAIEQTEASLAKQERIKTGLMQDLLTLGIDEHGNLRSESTHEFKDSPLGRIPQDWSATSFGKIFSDYGGHVQTGPFGSQLHSHEYVIEGIPVVMPQDIISGHINTADIAQISELKATALARHRMLPGDLIFARRGDLSKCAVIQQVQEGWICGTGCLLMRPPLKALSPRWTAEIYRFYTTQRQVSIHAVGSTMPNLNTEILTSLVVARSPLEEQQRIEERLRGTEDHESINRNQLNKLKLLKMGLMQDLLTGRKRVTPLLELEHAH
jgi:type I restriction enzyme S subunit